MAANAAGSDVSDGPVLSVINKKLRALRKKHNRIVQMEEAVSQGKTLNKEQEEVLRSKPGVVAIIEELEKLRSPIASALSEELALHEKQSPEPATLAADESRADESRNDESSNDSVLSDLLNLLYFGSLFDVKSQSDFQAAILTRTHERECCLTYDYVTDDATDMLGEKDLDLISMLGGLMISRPIDSSLSHKSALQRCIEHARLWLANADKPIEPNADITYAGLREKLKKIMVSDYFTTTPEMKAPVEMAAAANYGSFQVPVHGSVVPVSVPVQVESSVVYQEQDENTEHLQEQESGENQSIPIEEFQKEEFETENPAEGVSVEQEQVKPQAELELNHEGDLAEAKEHNYIPRRQYQNQRGFRGGGRRGNSNGRGGRGGGRGGGGYQNGRNQYYDHQPGNNYYPRNYYNGRGRGGGRGGSHSYNNHGPAVQGSYASNDVGVKS